MMRVLPNLLAVLLTITTLCGLVAAPAASAAAVQAGATIATQPKQPGEGTTEAAKTETPSADELTNRAAEEFAQTAAAVVNVPWLERDFIDNPLLSWIIAGSTLLLSLVVFRIVRDVLAKRLEGVAKRTPLKWDDVLVRIIRGLRTWLMIPLFVYLAAGVLVLPPGAHRALHIAALIGIGVQLIISSREIVDAVLQHLLARSQDNDGQPDPALASSMGVLRVAIFGVLIVIIVLLALDNLGVEITPMLTGLGIGGIAVALAVQNVLGDLFGSLTILLDKPFTVGDFIIVGDQMGTVEKIGIKSTRVRALSGEQLIFSNGDLLGSRIQNFRRMQERRVVFTIGVVYETPPEKLRRVAGIIKQAIENQKGDGGSPMVRFDRSNFKNFGAYSLDFEAAYYVHNRDYNLYMDIQEKINLELFERFAKEGLEFAYPTAVEIQRRETPKEDERPNDDERRAERAGGRE